jgi:hypothetical protein
VYKRKDGRWVGQYFDHTSVPPQYRYVYAFQVVAPGYCQTTVNSGFREALQARGGVRRYQQNLSFRSALMFTDCILRTLLS